MIQNQKKKFFLFLIGKSENLGVQVLAKIADQWQIPIVFNPGRFDYFVSPQSDIILTTQENRPQALT